MRYIAEEKGLIFKLIRIRDTVTNRVVALCAPAVAGSILAGLNGGWANQTITLDAVFSHHELENLLRRNMGVVHTVRQHENPSDCNGLQLPISDKLY